MEKCTKSIHTMSQGIKPIYVKDVGIFSVPVANNSTYDCDEVEFDDFEYLKRPLLSKKEKNNISKKYGPIPDPIQIDTYIGVRKFRLQQNLDKKKQEYLIDKEGLILSYCNPKKKKIIHQTYYDNFR